MRNMIIVLLLLGSVVVHATTGTIAGIVYETNEQKPIPFASIALKNTTKGTSSNSNGTFRIEGISTGSYHLMVSFLGYEAQEIEDILVTEGEVTTIRVILKPVPNLLSEVIVKAKTTKDNEQELNFLHKLTPNDLQYMAGSANDVLQTVSAFSGIATPVSFSNELMVRGGASIENSFYVETVELPLINHFSTQGSANGIRSILHNSLLREVNVHTSAFPTNIGHTVSSVFDFSFKNGNTDSLRWQLLLSNTDGSITVDGPLSKQSTFAFAARRSYLKPTLKLLDRPLLATYNDWNAKIHWNVGTHNTLTLLSVGNIDLQDLNEKVSKTPLNQYLLEFIAAGTQQHATNALKFQNFKKNRQTTISIASSAVTYNFTKGDKDLPSRFFNNFSAYQSKELKQQLFVQNSIKWNKLQWRLGSRISNISFRANSFVEWGDFNNATESKINYQQWNTFSEFVFQQNKQIHWLIGVKIAGNNFAPHLKNPIPQLSPRASFSFKFNTHFSVKAHAGIYYQLPTNLTLSFRGQDGQLANKTNSDYFSARHLNLNFNWRHTAKKRSISLDFFHKNYQNYPFSIEDQIVLANKGNGFSRVGEEAIESIGTGRAYGMEWNIRQNLQDGFYSLMSYTLSKSEFFNTSSNRYLPAAADARHILNWTAGKHFSQNWHIGFKGRFQSGLPYTPFDLKKSASITTWNPLAGGVKDYAQTNSLRQKSSYGVDLRVDKTIQLKRSSLKLFMDLLDVIQSKVNGPPFLATIKDNQGFPVLADQEKSGTYQIALLDNRLSSFLITFGGVIDF